MTAIFYVGDAVTVMNTLPEKSVDLILTSPPFLALRSYLPQDHPDKALEGGSQATPGAYIDWLLDVVEACARVLAPHGSLCFELGDTYSGGSDGRAYEESGWTDLPESAASENEKYARSQGRDGFKRGVRNMDAKFQPSGSAWPLAKSLSLIPETFRFAMVYGHNPHTGRKTEPWRLRNVIRWVRPNPPVGALGDKFRPATSELMVFCKAKDRFFDLDAVRGEFPEAPHGGWPISEKYIEVGLDSGSRQTRIHPSGAPPLDWWNIPPGGYPGAHYAVWPPELLIKPIKAMCPSRVCRVCGEASRRIVSDEVRYVKPDGRPARVAGYDRDTPEMLRQNVKGFDNGNYRAIRDTLGFSDCGHDDYRPGLVLDPFAGSGTTLSVATGHGRDAIGIDLDGRNAQLARERVGFFLTVEGDEESGFVKSVESPMFGAVAGDADDNQIESTMSVDESSE